MKITIIDTKENVDGFLSALGIASSKQTRYTHKIKEHTLNKFSQDLKAELPNQLAYQRTIIYRGQTNNNVTLHKIRIRREGRGKSHGYRCPVISIKTPKETFVLLMDIYTHNDKNNISKSEKKELITIINEIEISNILK